MQTISFSDQLDIILQDTMPENLNAAVTKHFLANHIWADTSRLSEDMFGQLGGNLTNMAMTNYQLFYKTQQDIFIQYGEFLESLVMELLRILEERFGWNGEEGRSRFANEKKRVLSGIEIIGDGGPNTATGGKIILNP